MKKIAKAAIATGAAALLLIGSGGTLAYWNDSANISGQSAITAGNLHLTATGTPTWKIKHTTGAETTVADISALRMVPGDKLTYSFPASITTQGQDLRFKVGLAGGSVAAPASPTSADTALAARLTNSVSYAVTGATPVAAQPDTFDHKSNSSASYTTTITATIDWPFTGTTAQDNPAKSGKVNLSNFTLTVTQVDASL
ncbi:alternate-type signal peptide domain-containing protein [Leucobacter coleopterorum]|uniref:Alternate-type signal peptide domain-containing protein n=1 Tax=Leucobacter coleopterorum TaxID=2714933 RepID=A0ABX6JWH9_9MICO|nr:alternate-type signal peptide domain-containing protein [Leucobacter coleopterorum]QIM17933.1 alternate-type signal peptide domain-containing protein [Leucobacter coleopterorum]